MKIRSFAKINLGIEVLGTRPDGYHDILTLFQIDRPGRRPGPRRAPGGEIVLPGDDPEVPWDGTNLVHRAAALLKEETGCRNGAPGSASRNPSRRARGSAGGAATPPPTLFGLNILWDLGLGQEDLARLGARLGADVPYFLEGGLCLGEGRGDRLTPLPDLPPAFILLAFPPFSVADGRDLRRLASRP